jgi:hypothetical protein
MVGTAAAEDCFPAIRAAEARLAAIKPAAPRRAKSVAVPTQHRVSRKRTGVRKSHARPPPAYSRVSGVTHKIVESSFHVQTRLIPWVRPAGCDKEPSRAIRSELPVPQSSPVQDVLDQILAPTPAEPSRPLETSEARPTPGEPQVPGVAPLDELQPPTPPGRPPGPPMETQPSVTPEFTPTPNPPGVTLPPGQQPFAPPGVEEPPQDHPAVLPPGEEPPLTPVIEPPAVTPVPEPATWMMLISGFAFAGFSLRWQRRAVWRRGAR